MIPIHKNNEPTHSQQYRLQPDAEYDGADFTPVKQKIRESLAEEQGHICAYCMCRIEPDKRQMKIEHWHSQANYSEKQLSYTNMLGCCHGNEGFSPALQHCDTAKANKNLLVNPSDLSHHNKIKIVYTGNGTIASDNTEFNQQLSNVLNLNCHRLKENRKAVWKSVTKILSRYPGTVQRGQINKLLEKWQQKNPKGKLPEYCGVAIYYLSKKIRRMS